MTEESQYFGALASKWIDFEWIDNIGWTGLILLMYTILQQLIWQMCYLLQSFQWSHGFPFYILDDSAWYKFPCNSWHGQCAINWKYCKTFTCCMFSEHQWWSSNIAWKKRQGGFRMTSGFSIWMVDVGNLCHPKKTYDFMLSLFTNSSHSRQWLVCLNLLWHDSGSITYL